MLFVSGKTKSDRLVICQSCDHFVESTSSCGPLIRGKTIVVDDQEKDLCGCIMPIKVGLRVASCPLGMWSTHISERELQSIKEFVETIPNTLTAHHQKRLLEYYNKITGQQRRGIGCCGASARNLLKTLNDFVYQSERSLARTREGK